MKKIFAECLTARMKDRGVTAKDLSNILKEEGIKVSYRTVEGWKDSRGAMPGADIACSVARVLKTTVETLVYGKVKEQLPERLRSLFHKLELLPDQDIEDIEALVTAKISRITDKTKLA